MAAFKKVALWGVGGENIGGYILDAIVNDGDFTVTIIARKSSKATYRGNLSIIRVDDDLSHASLVEALKGQDVVVSAVGTAGVPSQWRVAQAAAEAGVKRFIPSEYGFDNGDLKNTELSPIFKPKGELEKELILLAQEHPKFSWTAIATGVWLDWALDAKFLDINPEIKSVTYWDLGIHAPSMTTLPYAAQGVIQLLKHSEQFKNQRVFMQAFAASQKQIVAELEKQQGIRYTTATISGVIKTQQVLDTLANGFDINAAYGTVKAGILLPEFKADFVASRKAPILEHVIDLPKVTLEDVVRGYLEGHRK